MLMPLVRRTGNYIANDDYTNVYEMNKKMIERIAVFALAAFLIGYFVYQVAYGMIMGPNGTMTMTQGNISAILRAPPGTNVTHFGIIPEQTPIKWTNFTNSTWTMYNGSIGSASTITFKTTPSGYTDGDFTVNNNVTTFARTLHGHTYTGIAGDGNGLIYTNDTLFQLCSNKWDIEPTGINHLGCDAWKILVITPNHMEFNDQHGDRIHLMKDGSTMSGWM
jgi:hypothetical protein